MKTLQLVVAWPEGLHARPASRLVLLLQQFRSRVVVRTSRAVADGRSVLSLLALCATMNTVVEIQAEGEDAELALGAVQGLFLETDPTDRTAGDMPPARHCTPCQKRG